ncbi:STAS domain-containing protein [Methylomonas koyamae]|uniref:STAS domain-containing protein n=1 Tax=Methylomonas koyamae TaxID=702114 RepID=UPI00287397F2|nr:STAS domain-containing protein [Methylomonas koyamae]WNB77814.1 STAS domain-containing protein [Methylomonas koyamae]
MAENGENSLIGYDPLAWMKADAGGEPSGVPVPVVEPAGNIALEPQLRDGAGNADDVADAESVDSVSEPEPQAAGRGTVVLEPLSNIQGVASLHHTLVQMLNQYDALDIDASAVTSIDTSTLQLLVVLKCTAAGLQKVVAIDFPSEKFVEAAQLLGVSEMLEVDAAVSGFF